MQNISSSTIQEDPCYDFPCKHGYCYPSKESFYCYCDYGYSGIYCETSKSNLAISLISFLFVISLAIVLYIIGLKLKDYCKKRLHNARNRTDEENNQAIYSIGQYDFNQVYSSNIELLRDKYADKPPSYDEIIKIEK